MDRHALNVAADEPSRGARARVDRLLQHPVTELGIVVLIIASVALLVIEAVYAFDPATASALLLAGDIITGVFAVELALRYWVAAKKRRFFRRYWVDLVAILPLTRSLRLFRVLRLLRMFRAGLLLNRRITRFQGIFKGAFGELTLLGTLTMVLIFAGTVILYLVEQRGPFANVSTTLWFGVFTLFASEPIGGDPETTVGRIATLALMFGGMTIFGIFVGTISASMLSRLTRRGRVHDLELDELSGHVIVCGWNASGPLVLQELFGGRADHLIAPVVLVTEHDEMPANISDEVIKRELLYHLSGDYTKVDVLESANIRRASAAVVLADSQTPRSDQDRDARTVLATLTIERLNPGIFTCAELRKRENGELLAIAGVDEIVVPEEYSGVIIGSVGRNRGFVRIFDEILSSRYGNSFQKVALPAAWTGRPVRELFIALKEQHDAILVSVEAGKRGKPLVNPPLDHTIAPETTAVVIAEKPVVL